MKKYRELRKEIRNDLKELAQQRMLLKEEADTHARILRRQESFLRNQESEFKNERTHLEKDIAELKQQKEDLISEFEVRKEEMISELEKMKDDHEKEMEEKINVFNNINNTYNDNKMSLKTYAQ